MRFPELLIVACASIGLGGCAFAPSTPSGSPAVAAATPLQRQAPLPHRGTVTDLTRWRQDLGDALLADLQEAAQQANPTDARIAEAGYREWQEATEARYKAGLASLAELEDARRTRLVAADGLMALRLERILAWIDLYRAAGGGWTSASAAPQP